MLPAERLSSLLNGQVELVMNIDLFIKLIYSLAAHIDMTAFVVRNININIRIHTILSSSFMSFLYVI